MNLRSLQCGVVSLTLSLVVYPLGCKPAEHASESDKGQPAKETSSDLTAAEIEAQDNVVKEFEQAGMGVQREIDRPGQPARVLECLGKATDPLMTKVPHLKRLVTLQLQGSRVTESVLDSIVQCAELNELGLDGCPVTNEGLKKIKKLSNIDYLSLGGSKITDGGLQELTGLSGLRTLNLANTGITDACLSHLKQIKSLGGITLTGTKVTDAGVAELKKEFPTIKINR